MLPTAVSAALTACCVVSVLLLLLPTTLVGASSVTLRPLFESWKKVGFVSEGNYNTVQPLVPNAVPVIIANREELDAAVRNGTIDAALISGVPDGTEFETYNSGSISPRGMMTRQGDNFSRQLADALIVRLIMTGKLFEYAAGNAPFDFVQVHTCRSSDVDLHLPFPLTSSSDTSITLKVGALGPYNFFQDGDYTVSPPTGFWPDVFEGLKAMLPSSLNVTLERKYYASSNGVMNALANGEVHFTEPYWTIDSFYQNRPRTWTFDEGCLVLGYESTFFTKKQPTAAAASPSSADADGGPNSAVVALIVLASVAVVLLTVVLFSIVLFCGKKGDETTNLRNARGVENEELQQQPRSEVEHKHEPTA